MLTKILEDKQSIGHKDWTREEDVNKIMNLFCKTIWEKETLKRLGTMGYSTHQPIQIVLDFLKENKRKIK